MPRINVNMQWLIPLGAAAWAVWTWAADRERERMQKRARISALYVNPFLYQEFEKFLGSPPMSESASVKETLEALRSAEGSENLPGRERLVRVQNHLVDLLAHVERKIGYSVYHGKRKKCRIQGT